MTTILLTWNPSAGGMSDDEYSDVLEDQGADWTQWSVSNRKSGIVPGDRVFVLRQGGDRRGIVAAGFASSEPFQDQHWEDPSRTTNYIEVEWEVLLDIDDRLSTEILKGLLPDVHWQPFASGTEVKPPSDSRLERIWASTSQALRWRFRARNISDPSLKGL